MQTTKAARVCAEITALLRARKSILVVTTSEEPRSEAGIREACANARYPVFLWDCWDGLFKADGTAVGNEQLKNPNEILRRIADSRERAVYILRDLQEWYDPVIRRAIRSLARKLKSSEPAQARAVILLCPVGKEIPADIASVARVIDYPIPERGEVAAMLDAAVAALPDEKVRAEAITPETREAAIEAACGLDSERIEDAFSVSLVQTRKVDPLAVASDKRRAIAGIPGLTWFDPHPLGLSAIGGLERAKRWALERKVAFSPEARAFGLRAPRGLLLVGMPGCGKTLFASALATAWQRPGMRFDPGATRSKFVGESESNFRRVLPMIDTIGGVLVIDEAEKALPDASGPQGDGGVRSDTNGVFFSWLNDRTSDAFVMLTCNKVDDLAPELLRKGRLDEVFFVDLPSLMERAAVAAVASLAIRRPFDPDQCAQVAKHTEGFSGAEITACFQAALFTAFHDGQRELRTDDVIAEAGKTIPLSRSRSEAFVKLREWAKANAVNASDGEIRSTASGRSLDM